METAETPWGPEDFRDLRHGATLFNNGRYWHAHEAWESVWIRHRATSGGTFCKGLIQLAAAHHQRMRGRFAGMMTHFDRAHTKLAPFAPSYLGLDVRKIVDAIATARAEANRLGKDCLPEFDAAGIPPIRFPEDPHSCSSS
jgi:uncharacterized protein